MRDLDGRSVIVTGAGRGLGRAYARAVAEAGARVVVNDIDPDLLSAVHQELEAIGADCRPSLGSVSDWEAAGRMIEVCESAFGRVDCLVNNAGQHYVAPAEEDTPERMRGVVEVNVLGTLFAGVHAIRRMLVGRGGVILNVCSGAASGLPGMATYGASKGAVASVTWTWAEELRGRGIRVNAIEPAALTAMVETTRQSRPSPVTWPPEKIAPLVVFLLSDRSRHITGQVVRLWGDDLQLTSHHHPMPPILCDNHWTAEKIEDAFAAHLNQELQVYGRDMTDYIPFAP
jgi:NAD(P)-dependent dehydrogenase (short-subunit alcohol dehydrogenase family)